MRSLLYLLKICLISSTVLSQLLFHHGTGTEQAVVLALVLDRVKFVIFNWNHYISLLGHIAMMPVLHSKNVLLQR